MELITRQISTNYTVNDKSRTDGLERQISKLFKDLIVYYQNTTSDRQKLAVIWQNVEGFTVWEEIELLTVDIRGYASQIIHHGQLKNPRGTQDQLVETGPFKVAAIVEWYVNDAHAYPHLKLYVEMLDYLRLLLIEYCFFS